MVYFVSMLSLSRSIVQKISIAYIHTCIHSYIHTRIHAYIHTCIRSYMHTYIHTFICAYVHTFIRSCMHTYIHTRMHTCTHTHIHTYIHIYIHTWTKESAFVKPTHLDRCGTSLVYKMKKECRYLTPRQMILPLKDVHNYKQTDSYKLHYQRVAQGLYLRHYTATCFGHTFRSLSGS